MRYNVELTDTFGGEANYAWVRRAEIEAPTRLAAIRRAKAAMGITGTRGRVSDYGDSWDFRPYGACLVMFVFEAQD